MSTTAAPTIVTNTNTTTVGSDDPGSGKKMSLNSINSITSVDSVEGSFEGQKVATAGFHVYHHVKREPSHR